MSLCIKFYFISSMLNMFQTLIHPSSGACDFSIVSPHWLCVLVSMCVGVSVWLVGVVSVWQASACYTTIFTEHTTKVVIKNLINSDIKLVSYSSTITMMHGPICIRLTMKFFTAHIVSHLGSQMRTATL